MSDLRPRVAGVPFGPEPVPPPVPVAEGQVGLDAMIDPRVHLVLTLEEAAALLAWLDGLSASLQPPVARELGHALSAALADE